MPAMTSGCFSGAKRKSITNYYDDTFLTATPSTSCGCESLLKNGSVLKSKGSIFCFYAPEMAGCLEVAFVAGYNILSQIV